MSKSDAGKGDTPRPVNKKKYDEGYIRIFGQTCPNCEGLGIERLYPPSAIIDEDVYVYCSKCNGKGKVYDVKPTA